MNTTIVTIDNYHKNLREFINKKAIIFPFCLITAFSLVFFNLQTLTFQFQPSPLALRPSMAWAETAGPGTSGLPDNSEHFRTKTDEYTIPSLRRDLLQEKLMEKPQSAPYSSRNFTSYMLKASFSLAVVLIIILTISYLLKKYYLKGNLFGGKLIHLLDTCRLGSKKSLILTRIENQTLLLGITGQQITLLSEILPSEKSPLQKITSAASNADNFIEQLSKNSAKLQQNQSKNSTTNIANILEDRFKGLKKI